MANQEKSGVNKIFELKAQEFLSSRRYSDNLVDIVNHLKSGADVSACLLALEYIFINVLKDRKMLIEIIPLKPPERSPEMQYKQWLQDVYEKTFSLVLTSLESPSVKLQLQALSVALNLLTFESQYPIQLPDVLDNPLPTNKLKAILIKILSEKQNNAHLITKISEYLLFDDFLFFTWKMLALITAKTNPNEIYITNYLTLLSKLQVEANSERKLLCVCDEDKISEFGYDPTVTRKCLNKMWNCVILWQHSLTTHKQLLIVLLENVLSHLEKPLLMTDFLMDSLDIGGPISLLALQGIFTMIQVYNLNYPNIYTKLYSMFEPEIFHTKFKGRLFYLADLFLSSTHLPELLVAAFVKRLARLALVAPPEDTVVICMFIGNLIMRHPGLKCLLNHSVCESAVTDPYIMEERDPVKSLAINSSLWEIESLKNHEVYNVSTAARFIDSPLPKTEWDFTKYLENSSDDIFDKELKKYYKSMMLAFDIPYGLVYNKNEKFDACWNN